MLQNRLPARYRVIEEVGQGGMAVVYRATDEQLHREVAIKLLHPHLLSEPESKARLEREARAVAKLQHDNIVQIFDYSGSDSPSSYIVTEFIDGQTLKQWLAGRTLPVPEVGAMILIEIGKALKHAHALGIIHRDVKPENVMVRKDGALKLMDFGIAQIIDFERMTVTGQLLGSPAYMAPELLEGKTIDFRTDVFSSGIVLYQLCTGKLPFSGRNPHEVLKRVAEGRFADPRVVNPRIADHLARIITRALARKPEDRFASIDLLVNELVTFTAQAGLEHANEELKAFFTDPAGYAKQAAPRMIRALVQRGKDERVAGRAAAALELWNRALTLDPDNRDIAAEIRRLAGSRRLKTVAIYALAAAGIALSAGTAAEYVVRGRAPAAQARLKPSAPAPATPPVQAALPLVGTAAERETPAPPAATPAPERRTPIPEPRRVAADPDHPGNAPAVAVIAPAPTRRFRLGPTPKVVEVWLDGTKRFDYDLDHTAIDVPWRGSHELEFKSRCCVPWKITLGPDHPLPPGDQVVAQLAWRDAFLTVAPSPARPGVRVIVTEASGAGKLRPLRLTPEPGSRVPIRFEPNDSSRKTLDVTVTWNDKVISKSIVLTAGESQTLPVPLDN